MNYIYRNYDMIVIGKLLATRKDTINIQEDDEGMAFDDDQNCNEGSIEVDKCSIKIDKLIAINKMEFNVYHYNY